MILMLTIPGYNPDTFEPKKMKRIFTIDNRPAFIEYNDEVIFNIHGLELKYRSRGNYLAIVEGGSDHGLIFDLIGLKGTEKFEFAAKHYNSKEPSSGFWPYSPSDGQNIRQAQLVNAIFDHIKKHKKRNSLIKNSTMVYTNATRPMGNLNKGDRVIFNINGKELTYIVCDSYLQIERGEGLFLNSEIFKELGLSTKEMHKLTSEIYGYDTTTGLWPEFKRYDFASATKLVMHIFNMCDWRNSQGSLREESYIVRPIDSPVTVKTEARTYIHGQKYSCMIDDVYVTGKVSIHRHDNGKTEIFLCQNLKNGCSAADLLGYKFSWTIASGTAADLKQNCIANLILDETTIITTTTTKPKTNGQTINVPRANPAITSGQRCIGSIIPGRRSKLATAVGPQCYQKRAISC